MSSPSVPPVPQGVLCGVAAGFSVSLWLAIGSTLYPPSAEIMGVLPLLGGDCSPSNDSLSGSLVTEKPSSIVHLHPDEHE